MLSGILHSKTAISVSIAIMEAFVAMRHFLMNNGGMVQRLANVESKIIDQDARLLNHEHKLDSLFEAMDRGELKTKDFLLQQGGFHLGRGAERNAKRAPIQHLNGNL
ncbi:MAG: hypothetical protein SPM09_08560 [Fibrobacter sp.]|uniref:hypothetical protein n=1 Tax=Fibrobacter sp. TaxID=35828 RepID=UPI002A911EE5|nr:hypothetical protein [Fibrobacter sp.]MDY6264443.1 hypothetical protein [Fibrobacter sp.]